MLRPNLSLAMQSWPYRHPIAISRGELHVQTILYASATLGQLTAQGEGEQHESDVGASEQALSRGRAALDWICQGADRAALRARLWEPAGMEFDAFYTLESTDGQEIAGILSDEPMK